MEIKEIQDKIHIHCGKNLDKTTVLEQKNQLLHSLKQNPSAQKSFMFHAKDLITVDTPGLQLLLSFCQTLKKQGLTWHWVEESPTLQEAAKRLGANLLLSLPEEKN